MGLGSFRSVTLTKARDLAADAKRQLRGRVDPIDARAAARQTAKQAAAQSRTFKDCAEAYIDDRTATLKRWKLWQATLETYASPVASGRRGGCASTISRS
jgi:hypothetical protein